MPTECLRFVYYLIDMQLVSNIFMVKSLAAASQMVILLFMASIIVTNLLFGGG